MANRGFEKNPATEYLVSPHMVPPPLQATQRECKEVGGRLQYYKNQWANIQAGHWVLTTISEGYKLEFTGEPHFNQIRSTPLPSNPDQRRSLLEEVDKLLTKKAIFPIFPPYENGYWSTFFLAIKKTGDWRPILNLKPLNHFIKPKKFRMESLSTILRSPIKGNWATSIDLKDAYLHIPIHPSQFRWLRFMINKQAYAFRSLPFGLSTAPRVFTRVVKEVGACLRRRGIQIYMYLDDWLILGPTARETVNITQTVMKIVSELGFIINIEKSCLTPSQTPSFLGARIDLLSGYVVPSQERIQKLIQNAKTLALKELAPASEWLRVLGLMASMVELVPLCRLRMRVVQLHFIARHNAILHSLHHQIQVTKEVKEELIWWSLIHNLAAGVPFPQPPHQLVVTTDASKIGWGGFIPGQSAKGTWTVEESRVHINLLELWAVRNTLIDLGQSIHHQRVLVKSDNSTVVSYINKQGGTRSEVLCMETRKLILWCLNIGTKLSAVHIPGTENTLADNLSRGVSLSPTEWSLTRTVFQELLLKRTFPTVDLFSTRKNKQLPVYCTRYHDIQALAVDALSISWEGIAAYAFPPISLINRVVQKISEEECTILLIAPLWPRQHWFQNLLLLTIADPITLPRGQNLLRMIGSNARYHDTESLHLTAWTLSNNDSRRRVYLQNQPIWRQEEEDDPLSRSTILVPDHSLNGARCYRKIQVQRL